MKRLAASLTLVACVAVALAFGAASGHAGLLGCGYTEVQQPFTAWGDNSSYVLAPGGSFEDTNTWALSGGAQVVAGNEPFYLRSPDDSHSLLLPAGSSASSPSICLSVLDPTLRFVGKSSDGSDVHVDVYTSGALGLVKLPISMNVPLGTSWNPSDVESILLQNLVSLTDLGGANIVLRFSPIGSATVQIDDVYVDPMFHE